MELRQIPLFSNRDLKSSVSPPGSTYHITNEGKRANMVKPITGMLRRGLVLDLSVAFGLGTASGYFWWYGFHMPAVRRRDLFYAKLEDQRAEALGQA
ncbi:hypothetical protein NU195Hw_g7306t1 [Hortaea werneckii]